MDVQARQKKDGGCCFAAGGSTLLCCYFSCLVNSESVNSILFTEKVSYRLSSDAFSCKCDTDYFQSHSEAVARSSISSCRLKNCSSLISNSSATQFTKFQPQASSSLFGCLENDDLENKDLRPRKRRPRKRWPRKQRPRKRWPRKRRRRKLWLRKLRPTLDSRNCKKRFIKYWSFVAFWVACRQSPCNVRRCLFMAWAITAKCTADK